MIPSNAIPPNLLRCMPPEDRPKGPAGMTWEENQAARDVKSEKELQRLVGEYLRQRDIFAITSGMHRASSTPCGTPDFIFAVRSYNDQAIPVAVECKSATGNLSEEQARVREKLLNDGWIYAVVRELSDLKQLVQHLEIE